MAVSLPFIEVHLKENDIPGAKFVHKNVEEHTVVQLKRWLDCRSLKTNGKKEDLINRLVSLSRPSFFTYYTIVLLFFIFLIILLPFSLQIICEIGFERKGRDCFPCSLKRTAGLKLFFIDVLNFTNKESIKKYLFGDVLWEKEVFLKFPQ